MENSESAQLNHRRGAPPERLWKPGESGNPAGRPKGVRNKFAQDFVVEFAEHWAAHGGKVLDTLAKEDPSMYARVACAILPRVIELDEDTRDALTAIAAALPFAALRPPIECLPAPELGEQPQPAQH